MSSNKSTILIIDDEIKILEAVASFLESKEYRVITAHNGQIGLNAWRQYEISLILLDLMLPDIRGEEIAQIIRRESQVPIIMLTAKVEEDDLLKGLGLGADDYVTKPFSLKTLHARIEAVLRRSNIPHSTLTYDDGILEIDLDNYLVKKHGQDVGMTPNEFKLLSTFIKNPTKVFTREELIESTFGIDFDGYDRTIDSHIRNIRNKIENDNKNPNYIITVHGIGYTFGGKS